MTGFLIPTAVPTVTGWRLTDYKPDVVLTSAPAAGGVATATGPQLDPGVMWLVNRAVCWCTSSTATTLYLYDTAQSPANLRDGSTTGNFDVTEYAQPLMLGQGRQLLAVWAGAADGAVGTLTLQVQVLRWSGA